MTTACRPITLALLCAGLSMPAHAQGYGSKPVLTPEVLAAITDAACVETGGNLMKMTAMAGAARLPETARVQGALASWKLPGMLTISAMEDGNCRVTIDDHSIEWLDSVLAMRNANVLLDEATDGDSHTKRIAFRTPARPGDDNIRLMEVVRTSDELADTLAVSIPGEARQEKYRAEGLFEAARRRLDLKSGFQLDQAQTAFARYCLETGGEPDLMRERVKADGGVEKPGTAGSSDISWTLADPARGNGCSRCGAGVAGGGSWGSACAWRSRPAIYASS